MDWMCNCGLALLFFLLLSFQPAESGYLVTTPRVYRTGSTQHVNVHLYGNGNQSWNIIVLLTKPDKKTPIAHASKVFTGDAFGTIRIKVPKSVPSIKYGKFNNVNLGVFGRTRGPGSGIPFVKHHALTLEKQSDDTIFIQTDKPIYKPGQTIRLRVVGINHDLKPLGGKVKRISIMNPTKVRMMQWNNMDLKNGIVSVEMPLSKYPVLGIWKIQTLYKGKKAEKSIEVSKYVLPKFEVTIEPPPFIAKDSKVVKGSICAKYTYGQPVTGLLNAKFVFKKVVRRKLRCYRFWCPSQSHDVIQHQSTMNKKIKGCHTFWFTNKQLGLQDSTSGRVQREFLNVTATVTEEATGIKRTAQSTETDVVKSKVNLKFVQIPTHFKPGLEFNGKISVTSPDGEPLAKETVTISAIDEKLIVFIKTYSSSQTGIIEFKMGSIPLKSKELTLKAVHAGSANKISKKLNPWFSPSSSFLLLKRKSQPLRVGSRAEMKFQYTLFGNKDVRDINYNVMCKGKAELFGKKHIVAKASSSHIAHESVNFKVKQSMVPACRLFVYFVRKDGEVVADSMMVDVEDTLENQVTVRFNDNVQRPGKPVEITMTTTPGSTVALAGVDKSIRLLGEVEDISADKIINTLPPNLGSSSKIKKKSCYKDNYVDTAKAIHDAGLIYLSNSNIESRPCLPFPTRPPRRLMKHFEQFPWQKGSSGFPFLFSTSGGRVSGNIFRRISRKRNKKKLVKKTVKKPVKKTEKKKVPQKPTKTVRKHFPETWLWMEETISNSTGQKTITAKVPDTITSWYLSAFAMSSRRGMGVSDPSVLTAFQPFFVSFTLPFSVIRGEQLSVVTTVFNYMSNCATIRIRLSKTSDFSLSSAIDQKLCICSNEARSVKYVITPRKLGHIPLTVTVQTVAPSLCGNTSTEAPIGMSDTVTRKLLVEPEGIRQEYTYSGLVCPKDDKGSFSERLKLSLPKKIVKGSIHATISAIGDLMGPSLTGLDGLLRLPTGCGEQNMVKFAPNIFIMQYLKSTNQLTGEIEDKAVGFLRTGYQRELTYKRKDGSYSAFGDRDKEGSLWLTAFVLRSFSQARPFIFVDDNEIQFTTKWIKQKQLNTGCFKKHGRLIHKGLQGGVSNPVTLTAYVVISLLESSVNPKSTVIVKALQCITSQKSSVTDPYGNAIIAYALTLAKHPDRDEFLKRLRSQAIVKDGFMHWEEEKIPSISPKVVFWRPPYIRASATSIEMTSYALLAMIGDGSDSNDIKTARNIVRWLSKQRNALGGFSSTQDTCVALQALSRYASFVHSPGSRLRIDIGQRQEAFSHVFRIDDSNRLVLQRVEIPHDLLPMNYILVDGYGDGCALVQADVLYNIPDVDEQPSFNLSVSVQPFKGFLTREKTEAGEELCPPLEVNVCARWLEKGESGMAVVDIKLVSGFTPDEDSLEKLVNYASLDIMKFELEESKVVFYFDKIKHHCFDFIIHQTSVVKKTKPASAIVYDYYDTDKSATTMYSIKDELCKQSPAQSDP